MNVAIRDGFNLGWKLATVVLGTASPEILRTYSDERQAVAKELIDFDRVFAKMMSMPPRSEAQPDGIDPDEFQRYFARQGRYTAGTTIQYAPSILVAAPGHQALAEGLRIGRRFHSAPVIRLADAKPVELGHAIEADGRWRLIVFAGQEDPTDAASSIVGLCDFLDTSPDSPIRRHTPEGDDVDSVIDVRAVFQQPHRSLALEAMPLFLRPRKGRYGLHDYEKMFCPDPRPGMDVFDLRDVDRKRGCVVVVRPDQHVANILPVESHSELAAFFGRFMSRSIRSSASLGA
jgi:phenol 2-monooxygenase